MSFPASRPRRLRRSEVVRRLVAETSLGPSNLVAPHFVKEGIEEPAPVESMPEVFQHTIPSLVAEVGQAVDLLIPAVVLFGIPAEKDPGGTAASAPGGIVQQALRALKDAHGDGLVLIADLCLDEYTDHGHCGVVTQSGEVDNDATLERYAEIAVAQAEAGADMVAPSGMMDGQVGVIRDALDDAGFDQVGILAYAAKYASAFYGPFREAAECAPSFGDRRAYQMDPANAREALREAELDEGEGADILMVKPAGPYLDVISLLRSASTLPIAAFQVSGEYAALRAASQAGYLDGTAVMLESLTGIRRAGADIILTYFAKEAARALS